MIDDTVKTIIANMLEWPHRIVVPIGGVNVDTSDHSKWWIKVEIRVGPKDLKLKVLKLNHVNTISYVQILGTCMDHHQFCCSLISRDLYSKLEKYNKESC
ncbi:hypothetical protein L1987_22250 [Smallanthus sonchifolius]|uniref:Uncharacterized protein n=1 Tax=Smallanthus sonchifolius TaxID=185202 RepID=A0ACB9IFT9_9ASTR|nr:hypothetical protein L1987_22250 [Smallanthus sonchifolius]